MFDLVQFINEGIEAQDKFAKSSGLKLISEMSREERYQMIVNMLAHASEELNGEVRAHVVRRPWKVNEKGCLDDGYHKQMFMDELFDVMLFIRGALAYAGFTGEEFAAIANQKLHYNSVREDHKTNV